MSRNKENTINQVRSRLNFHENESNRLYRKLRNMVNNGPLTVTDHALLRYLERVEGVDMAAVQRLIITDQLLELYRVLGDGELPNGKGNARCVIHNGVIVTILT